MTILTNKQVRDLAEARMSQDPLLCYQGAIRQVLVEHEPPPVGAPTDVNEGWVEVIPNELAKPLIERNEWLGVVGRPVLSVGLFFNIGGESVLAGVAQFGQSAGIQTRDVCGKKYRDVTICLERGVCVHWAPKNAASWFVPRTLDLAHQVKGWKVFFGYSDEHAKEIGTIYQACNWLYLGKNLGHSGGRFEWIDPATGKKHSSRIMRSRKLKVRLNHGREGKVYDLYSTVDGHVEKGWLRVPSAGKHKYVDLRGSKKERKLLRAAMKHPALFGPDGKPAYPKREVVG